MALLAGCFSLPAHASTVVVPDDSPTVQLGIDSGADTVLIRQGNYDERPLVDHAVTLRGIGLDQRPRLAGLTVVNTNFWAVPPALNVSALDFSGRVTHETIFFTPRNLRLSFSECCLDSGFFQLQSTDPDDVAWVSLTNCRLRGQTRARVNQVFMEADTLAGGVAWAVHEVWIEQCWFKGGPGTAIELWDTPRPGLVGHNQIENYSTGVSVRDADPYLIKYNTIARCGVGIALQSGTEVDISSNTIGECGLGISAVGLNRIDVLSNTIVRGAGAGVTTSFVEYPVIVGNVVAQCDGPGIAINRALDGGVLQSNTCFGSGGDGFQVRGGTGDPTIVRNNIAAGNVGWGLLVGTGLAPALGCNDWFNNRLGSVSGVAADSSDVALDPLFCDADSADLRLNSTSPVLKVAGCGQIGALGVGCGVTATLVQRFAAGRVSDGIRVVWEVAEGATASEIWLERSEGSGQGPWSRPVGDRSLDNRAVVELDRSAISEQAYWYRLVALEGRDAVVIGAPILVEAQARPEFRLTEVGPSPGRGPMRIAFSLEHAGAIEVTVLDVQGRTVARVAGGELAAGPHAIAWNGEGAQGRVPPGLYLIRYRFPGGQDSRRIVVSR